MTKITIVGAGAVGATSADNILRRQLAESIILLDIKDGLAEGKAIDMQQTASTLGFQTVIEGVTNQYERTAGSQVVVITSGMPRKPGMTREELIGVNANIVSTVVKNIFQYSPDAILVVVSNPMDTMTYLVLQETNLPPNRIIGMGGILDSSRFKFYLSKALGGVSTTDLQAMVIGGHGDTTMIPLIHHATWGGVPVASFLSEEQMRTVVQDTMVGGATLTKFIGTSAWYAPGASVAALVESIVHNQRRVYPCSVLLDGEYGAKDICIGVPVVLASKGWDQIVKIALSQEEQALFDSSVKAMQGMNAMLSGR